MTADRRINCSEIISQVVNNPRDPYGPPLVRYILRVREQETGRWYYVRKITPVRNGMPTQYTFTSDHTHARCMTFRTARRHQANMTADILDQ